LINVIKLNEHSVSEVGQMSQESKQEIMDATYIALCKHGYAELSIQKIADESDKENH